MEISAEKIGIILAYLLILLSFGHATTKPNCFANEFPCEDGVGCINRSKWCDKLNDCTDKSDEKYCSTGGWLSITKNTNECSENDYFVCPRDRCIPISAKCDGSPDCPKAEDEEDCTDETTTKVSTTKQTTTPLSKQTTTSTAVLTTELSTKLTTIYATNDRPTTPKLKREDITEEAFHVDDNSVERGVRWLMSQRKGNYGWGKDTARALVALALTKPDRFSDEDSEEKIIMSQQLDEKKEGALMKKRLLLELSPYFINNETNHLSSTRLASYINAMLATCQDPWNFYDIDLVKTLRDAIKFGKTSPPPSVYLSLCLANATEFDDIRAIYNLLSSPTAKYWPDFEILSTITLSCILDKLRLTKNSYYVSRLQEFVTKLKGRVEYPIKRFGALTTTALAVQALSSVQDTEKWDPTVAQTYLSTHQQRDGSFGNFMSTYYVLPALAGNGLLKLTSMPCKSKSPKNDLIPLEQLKNFKGLAMEVRYTLNYGSPVKSSHYINIRVPVGTSFFDIMRLAQDLDPKFTFLYTKYGNDVEVYSIGNVANDMEHGLKWQYAIVSDRANVAINSRGFTPSHKSVSMVIPTDGNHLVFWYKPLSQYERPRVVQSPQRIVSRPYYQSQRQK